MWNKSQILHENNFFPFSDRGDHVRRFFVVMLSACVSDHVGNHAASMGVCLTYRFQKYNGLELLKVKVFLLVGTFWIFQKKNHCGRSERHKTCVKRRFCVLHSHEWSFLNIWLFLETQKPSLKDLTWICQGGWILWTKQENVITP